jgi:hypothetical protein
MQGAPKRQVNAEEMLAELRRVLESSTPAPDSPPPSASTAPKSSSPGRDNRQLQIARRSDRPVKASADSSIGQPTDLQKSTRPGSRRWKLTAGGLALAGAVCASFALINKSPDPPTHELSVGTTEGLVRSLNGQLLKPSTDVRSLSEDSRQAAPLQAGNLETQPDASTVPASQGSVLAGGKAEANAPNLASSGIESTPPAFTPVPPSTPATLAPSQVIRLDGTPTVAAPPTPSSTDAAPPPAQTSKPPVPTAAPRMAKPDKASVATAPPTPSSTDAAPPPAQTSKPPVPTAAPRMAKPDKASVATAPPTPSSTDSASLAEKPKPDATPTGSAPNESARSLTPKIDSKKKSTEKPSVQKPPRSAKASAKSVAQAERQSTEPAAPKEAESAPHPAQETGNPTAAAPVTKTTVQQRVADGVSHAFGYLIHLPGALVPHLGGPSPDAH